MTAMVWDSSLEDSVLARYEDHTEFVLGVDFNLFHEGQIATTAWDDTVRVFKYQPNMGGARKSVASATGPAAGSSGAGSVPQAAAR